MSRPATTGTDKQGQGRRAFLTMMTRGVVEPHEDYGFFGPDSVTWKVWSYPTSLTVGFQRAVVIEELDPDLVAAVDKTHDIYKRPRTRYDRHCGTSRWSRLAARAKPPTSQTFW